MIRLFGRKPASDAAPDKDAGANPPARTSKYSLDDLAAAFPGAQPAPAQPADEPGPPPGRQDQAAPRPSEEVDAATEQAMAAANAIAAASAPALAQPASTTGLVPPAPVHVPAAPTPAAPTAAVPTVAPPPLAAVTPPPAVVPAPAPFAPAPPAPAAPTLAAAAPEPFAAAPGTPEPAAAGKPGWRERLRGSVFARSLGGLFSRNPKLDDDLLDEIETALLTADVGIAATTQLIDNLRRRMKSREFADANALLRALRDDLVAMLRPVAQPLVIAADAQPFVILTVGVNGVGKTTTIGKLAKRYKDEGHSLMLAAGDTFRAAAVAQLQAWGERNGVAVIAQGQDADAASVAFDALQAAKSRGTRVLIADTAGRLHTQTGLMNELGKIRRVLGKLDASAPHEVLMVIDGTTGQNALSQLRQFHAAVNVTGLVVTKLDGTAKGGVVFALAREFGIPIRYAGIGERPEDLRLFDPEAFVDALLPETLGA
ncbi:signal recognition particle-docking protein FtsY [Luteimonas sp. RIT-PG2_3]